MNEELTYEEKIARVDSNDFFSLFEKLNAAPRWVNSAGKQSIQLLGICHKGSHHSCVFDPSTLTVTCFSECGGGMLIHNWVKKALNMDSPLKAKDFLEDWIEEGNVKLTGGNVFNFEYKERKFEPTIVEPLPGIPKDILEELYSEFKTDQNTLKKLVWSTKDGILPEILSTFQVAYFPRHKTIILPHHNINGEIVGIFERNFKPLRAEVKKMFPDMHWRDLVEFPRAKYLPLLKDEVYIQSEDDKCSWSFPNSQNLYGLHLAKDAIKKEKKAIVFEGAKSVMLAHQYGYPFSVATHTFGINFNHVSMLIEAGAEEIILGFDKQYQKVDIHDPQWCLYEKKTRDVADQIGQYIDVSRIVDFFPGEKTTSLLEYKDSPIDKGKRTFERLYRIREKLYLNKEKQIDIERLGNEAAILKRLSKPKIDHTSKPEDDEFFEFF